MNQLRTFSLSTLLVAGTLSAQQGERFLPVEVSVTMNGDKAKEFSVVLYKDNSQVVELPPSRHSAFQLALDLNSTYTIKINKPGFREKVVFIDTQLPEGIEEYDAYPCKVNLEPLDLFAHADPFYLDFPSALARWDVAAGRFEHSGHYLDEIQVKMALLSAQAEAE